MSVCVCMCVIIRDTLVISDGVFLLPYFILNMDNPKEEVDREAEGVAI